MLYTREKLLELLERYLQNAERGDETLKRATGDQKVQIEALTRYISQNPQNDQSELHRVVEGLVALQNHLLDELEKSSQKNQLLQNELNKAQNEIRIDPLTHIFNRRKLEEDVTRLIKDNRSGRLTLYMLIIDADDFKKINDTHGHLAGDKVLVYLARAFKSILGQNNHLYRYGGEEFIVLSLHEKMSEALTLAENIRTKVNSAQMSHQGTKIQLTISIGLAPSRQEDTYETLFDRADGALFKAKSAGKNRVEAAD